MLFFIVSFVLQNPQIGIAIKVVAARHKIDLDKFKRLIFKCEPENPDGTKRKSIDCVELRRGPSTLLPRS